MNIARSKGDKILDSFIIAVLVILGIISLYPIYYVIIASVSNPHYISTGQVVFAPRGLNVMAYEKLLNNREIWVGYRNSIFYTVFGTAINLAVTLPCAYALSRKSLPGRRFFSLMFIFTMYFSGGMVPSYILLNTLHMLNTPWALLLPGAVSVFDLIVARSFFESSIPEAVFESARIDGSSITRFFFQIALPLSPAMIAVLALLYALIHWNSYFNAMIYIQNPKIQTLQVIIKNITAKLDPTLIETMTSDEIARQVQEQQLLKFAVVVVSFVPLFLAYPFIQRFFIRGVMIGAVKG